jgi:beta-phosphoglucomutase family hydrolase
MPEGFFDAVIFDLDGVITQTASLHSAAWKRMFDEFLASYSEKTGRSFREFSHQDDYLPYVDGKPRYDGVASFLQSRGIDLPWGDPADDVAQETVCGLGNRKNALFRELIAQGNVDAYPSTVALAKQLRKRGVRLGVASSSKNAREILDAAGLSPLFDTLVDGNLSAELGLQGKPAPDIFITACDALNAPYDRAVVVEDAVSGVQAGRNGNFGLVLGVARQDNQSDLLRHGADMVVEDLRAITYRKLQEWFSKGLIEDGWFLAYRDAWPEEQGLREALCTVGNGYFGTRGAAEECEADGINYPGTYIAGVYNRLTSTVAGREVSNEDIVNCPNWLPLTFKIGEGEWFDPQKCEVLSYILKLDFRCGVLFRSMLVRDAQGRETRIQSWRLASMADRHLAALRYRLTPQNYAGKITLRSGLNGRVTNGGVERYRQLNSRHLQPIEEGGRNDASYIVLETNQSRIQIAQAARLVVARDGEAVKDGWRLKKGRGAIYSTMALDAQQGSSITVDKLVALYTSHDKGIQDVLLAARTAVQDLRSYDQVHRGSAKAWERIWKEIDIQIEGDRLSQKLIRLHLFHTMVMASPHNVDIDASVPARGLHGEAYRGHIFWDELHILPFHAMHFPDTAKALLLYRYRRLGRAKANAASIGCRGAMYPWQSGSDGREETPQVHLNPLSGEWGADNSSRQRHVSLAIAYDVWVYFRITNDLSFLEQYGAELMVEICRFWADLAKFDADSGRYSISGVMGPDEYHEKYPDAQEGGLKDNCYTNIMVVWAFQRTRDVLAALRPDARSKLIEKLNLSEAELQKWEDIAKRIHIPISPAGILEQFEGYFDLDELDWDAYRRRYPNIARMDRILKAEGKSPDSYKVSKQADTLMPFYLLAPHEVRDILNQVGYAIENDLLAPNFEFYFKRTSHGSTLSRLVHSYLATLIGETELGWRMYQEALASDYRDIQEGTTKEGIHAGVMTGSILLTYKAYAGLNLEGEHVRVDPALPAVWRSLRFGFRFQGKAYHLMIRRKEMELLVERRGDEAVEVLVGERLLHAEPGGWKVLALKTGVSRDAR